MIPALKISMSFAWRLARRIEAFIEDHTGEAAVYDDDDAEPEGM